MNKFSGRAWLNILVLIPVSFYLFVIAFFPSGLFLEPNEYVLDYSGKVFFTRQVPYMEVIATFNTEIRLEDGTDCIQPDDFNAFYQKAEETNGFVTYQIREWAMPCLEKKIPGSVHVEWRVWAFGIEWFKLRPVIRTYLLGVVEI